MPSRVIALFIAAVLLWSGFSTIETPRVARAAPTGEVPVCVSGADGGSPAAGSVADHHLDDLPVQAQTDPPTDLPALPAVAARSRAHAPCERPAPAPQLLAAAPPFLAGPLRPPCGGHAIG